MDDLINEFLTETNESIGALDNDVVLLEQDPSNMDLLSKIFRIMHTIKGTCGFLGLPRLEKVAHKAEDLLGLFREGKKTATPENISLILEALDRIKEILEGIEKTGTEPEGDDTVLIKRLEAAAVVGGETAPVAAPEPEPVPEPIVDIANDPLMGMESIDDYVPIPVSAMGAPAPTPAPEAPVETPHVLSVQPQAADKPVVAAGEHGEVRGAAAQTLRVSVDVLEELMTMVSELVLTRNQILQISRMQDDSTLSSSLQRLNHIVSELQEGVMKTRMQPVGNAWAKLPRIIRDISSELGKKIDLDMQGQETELDRQVLEMIKDPLTHMVRNAADHGIENPEQRRAAGKPETGKVKLNSYHEGGHIIIEISDDGRGLPMEKIKNKIVQNGLATEAELANMSVQQVQQYIFHAGLSTAEKITSVSGRGVGMDVVRSNIEQIGGSIEMKSIEGKGSTFTIKIPLTLAIVSALIVGVGEERFAIPQLDVRELVMVNANGPNKIEKVNDSEVFRLRNRILPLVSLRKLMGLPLQEGSAERARHIAVIKVGGFNFGLIVERVFDTEEIVVKPLSSILRQQQVFSGNTILGDGQVIMILDPSGIMKTAGILDNMVKQAEEDAEAEAKESVMETPLLLFRVGSKGLKAVPLKHVTRLEEIELSEIEQAGDQRVIQYYDTLMPVFYAGRADTLPKEGKRPVIVFAAKNGIAGLIVDKIMDITNFRGEFQIKSDGPLAGSAIIEGQAADIINLTYEPETKPATSVMQTLNRNGHDAEEFGMYQGAAE
ncbi:chemotaxis protein CheA [Micavibrio aeruginosavorus]|uniref:chemotaxis protein CheA n=1 Tax=Micavibrio aeruginosavorus TaxID=349221 RepID=UPI003F4AECAE